MNTEFVNQVHNALIITTRKRRIPLGGRETVRIHRGVHLPSAFLHDLRTPWEQRRAISIARTLAVLHRREHAQPVARSAALLRGYDIFDSNPSIHIHIPQVECKSTTDSVLPAVSIDGVPVLKEAHCHVHLHGATLSTQHAEFPSRVLTSLPSFSALSPGRASPETSPGRASPETSPGQASPETSPSAEEVLDLVIQWTLIDPGEEAFVFTCQALRTLTPSSTRRLSGWEQQEASIRRHLLRKLFMLPSGTRNLRRAEWIIRHASAGCESIGEARLLWILRSRGLAGVVPQFEVEDSFVHYFIDLALPHLKIALEFDGRLKYGNNSEKQLDVLREQIQRQKQLEVRGWHVIRFSWADLYNPESIIQQIEEAACYFRKKLRYSAKYPVRGGIGKGSR